MVDEQLVSYLKENLAKGYTKEQLHDILSKNGWHTHDLDDAFVALDRPVIATLPPLPQPIKAAPTPPKADTGAASAPANPAPKTKGAEQFYVEPKDKRFNWKDVIIVLGMVLALAGVAYTAYILFIR